MNRRGTCDRTLFSDSFGCDVSMHKALPKGSPPRSPSRSTFGCDGVVVGVATAVVGVGVVGAVQVLMGWVMAVVVAAAAEAAWGLEVAVCWERI